jgi:hypothetical protein
VCRVCTATRLRIMPNLPGRCFRAQGGGVILIMTETPQLKTDIRLYDLQELRRPKLQVRRGAHHQLPTTITHFLIRHHTTTPTHHHTTPPRHPPPHHTHRTTTPPTRYAATDGFCFASECGNSTGVKITG